MEEEEEEEEEEKEETFGLKNFSLWSY